MTLRKLRTATAAMAVAGVALTVGGVVIESSTQIEGAYFNRSVGAPAYAAVFSGSTWKHDALIGAGLATMLVAATLAVVAARAADDNAAERMLRRIWIVLAGAGVLAAVGAIVRAETGPLRDLSLITSIKEGGILVSNQVTAPDFMLGVAVAWLAAALYLSQARTSSAWRSGGNTG